MKLPPNIPTALILTFLFSLQVPLRLAAPLSHDKLFPGGEPIVPLSLPQQIRYKRIDNGRIGTRHSNPNSNRDFPSPLPDSFPILPGSPVPSTGRLSGRRPGRLQKRSGNSEDSWDASAAAVQLQLSQFKRGNSIPRQEQPPSQPSGRRPGRYYPRPLKHLFAHSYHLNTGRLTEAADDDLLNLFNEHGPPPTFLKTITFEPTITISSTSIQRLGPGAGSYLAAMNIGGGSPRPWEGGAGDWENERETSSFTSRRISGIEQRREIEERRDTTTTTGRHDENEKREEREEKEESKTGREGKVGKGSKHHGRYHESLTDVAAAAAAAAAEMLTAKNCFFC